MGKNYQPQLVSRVYSINSIIDFVVVVVVVVNLTPMLFGIPELGVDLLEFYEVALCWEHVSCFLPV